LSYTSLKGENLKMNTLTTSGFSRRSFLKKGAMAAGALALISMEGPAFALGKELTQAANGDLDIANFEYGLEALAISAYQAAAKTGLLDKPVLDIALKFVDQHSQHQAAWEAEVKRLGGTPQALAITKYPALKSQADILNFAMTLESVAVGSYYIAIGKFKDASRVNIAAGIMPIEMQHVTVYASALKQDPIPSSFPTGKSQDEINSIATALGVGPVQAAPTPTPVPATAPAPGQTMPAPGAPNTGVGLTGQHQDDSTGIVVATLAAISAAAAGAVALRKRGSSSAKTQDEE
jgi:hypothetical protein